LITLLIVKSFLQEACYEPVKATQGYTNVVPSLKKELTMS